MPPKTRGKAKPLLTLHPVAGDASSAQMAVTWCVEDEAMAAHIQALGFTQPRLLLITQSQKADRFDDYSYVEWQDTGYQVVKLHRGLAYVTFKRPGACRVVAMLVDVGDKDSRNRLRKLTREDGRGYAYSVFDDSDKSLTRAWRTEDIRFSKLATATAPVDVDPELFAKPLSERRKWVLKRVFGSTKARDECDARKRSLIFGPLALPFVIAGTWLLRLVTLPLVLFVGFYKFPLGELKRPLASTNNDWFNRSDLFDRNFIYQTRDGTDRHGAFFIFSPHLLIALPLLAFGIMNIRVHYHNSKHHTHPLSDLGFWKTVIYVDLAYVALVAVVAAALFIGSFVADAVSGHSRKPKKKTSPGELDWDLIRRQLSLVVCGDDEVTSITDLSFKQLTPRLVFNAAKAKVCKPFAS